MTTLRGVSLAVFVFAAVVSFSMLGALGVADQAGVGMSPGLNSEKKTVDEGISDPESSNSENAGSFVGLATGALQVIDTLRILILHTSSGLQNLGIPRAIADGIQVVMDLAFVLALLALMLRFKA